LRLANPPIVEVGVEFQFDPNPEKPPWDLPVAMPFIQRFQESLPHVEIVQAEEIRIEKRSSRGIPEKLSGKISLDHVKAQDKDERRRLEVGSDRMGYRLLRCGKEYPGFDSLLIEALDKLSQYVEHFHPTAVRGAALTYLDIVKIPVTPGEGVDLDDYFRLGLRVPDDPFGVLGGFSIKLIFPHSPRADGVLLVFATEPTTEDGALRFRMRWQGPCDGINSLGPDAISQRLEAAHEHMRKCFMACFTEKGLGLFDPTGCE
jgi:uncharacterized protein (TIGR04255 family)